MTPDEWLHVCDLVAESFPPGWTPDNALRYGMDLRDESYERVASVIETFSGLPNARAIRRELGRRPERKWSGVIEKRHRELFPNGCPFECEICRPILDQTSPLL